jgi:2-iminobutanoate/2-iminopropanoate deaminase
MRKEILAPAKVWDSKTLGFAHGISVEEGKKLVFISGQNGIDLKGKVVSDDFAAQCRKAYENLVEILANAGGKLSNVVRLTAYVTDIKDADSFVKITAEFFKGELCSQTLVEVSALAFPELKVELEATAVL